MIGNPTSPAGEWRQNWTLVFVSTLGVAFQVVYFYSLGAMIAPIEQDLGWSRSEITSGMLITASVAVVMVPVIGVAIDRFGPRRIALMGCALHCIAIAALSQTTLSLWSWWLLWGGMALSVAFIGPTVWTASISSSFVAQRGLAQAIALCGTGLAAALIPIATTFLIGQFGWRAAYLVLGGFWALLMFPLLLLFFSSPADRHRASAIKATAQEMAPLPGLTAREGFRSASFFKLAAACGALASVVSCFGVNAVPILIWEGLTRESAATAGGLLGVGAIIGRFTSGWLLDRLDAKKVVGFGLVLSILPLLALLFLPVSFLGAALAVLVFGLTTGPALNGLAYLAAGHFGMRNFGTLLGAATGLAMLMNGLSPLLANHVYDVTRSYEPVLWGLIPLTLLASALFLSLGRYPDFSRPD